MKIVKLRSENVKRLSAVEVTPGEGAVVSVGGKNGAGKSSVLDSIAYALGGQALVPAEPIRQGESEARIVVDLGDLVVTRRFYREEIVDKDALGPDGKPLNPPKFVGWGPTKSTLSVANAEGARYPSPQAVLDRLLGQLTFDPLAFSRAAPRDQEATLRRLVGLDTTKIDERRAAAFSQRAALKKVYTARMAQVEAMPRYEGVPAIETPMDEISQEMLCAEHLRKAADDASRLVEKTEQQVVQNRMRADQVLQTIRELEDRLATERVKHDALAVELCKLSDDLKVQTQAMGEARNAVPDTEELRRKLVETEETNAKVRANRQRAAVGDEAEALAKRIDAETKAIAEADVAKRAALDAVKFPVEGLGLGDMGVTFGGVPFAQASSSEQLRTSVAIGLALNPKLKVLLVRNGNQLDDDSLKLLAAQAETAGAQVWLEYVTADAGAVSVMIEDGHAAERQKGGAA